MTKSKIFSAAIPKIGRRLGIGINVSSYGNYPYNLFSPFSYSEDFHIPVPGQTNTYSHSVEGIWQGLKLIGGQIDPDLFLHKPRKRTGFVQGHKYEDRVLGILEARKLIYLPSYNFYVENHIDEKIKEDVLERGLNKGVVFFDVADNTCMADTTAPLAHSCFLVDYFSRYLDRRIGEVREKIDGAYNTSESDRETLAEPISRVLNDFRASFTNVERQLAMHFLRQSHEGLDRYRKRFYNELKARIS